MTTRRVRPRRWWAWLVIGLAGLVMVGWLGQPRGKGWSGVDVGGRPWAFYFGVSLTGVSLTGREEVTLRGFGLRASPARWAPAAGLAVSALRPAPDRWPRAVWNTNEIAFVCPTWCVAPVFVVLGVIAWRRRDTPTSRVRWRVNRLVLHGAAVGVVVAGLSALPWGWNQAGAIMSKPDRTLGVLADSRSIAVVSATGELTEFAKAHRDFFADLTRKQDSPHFTSPTFVTWRFPEPDAVVGVGRLDMMGVLVRTLVVDWWLLAAITGVPAVWLAWRTRSIPPKDACRGCGYDLSGQTGGGCPECGWGRRGGSNEKSPHDGLSVGA